MKLASNPPPDHTGYNTGETWIRTMARRGVPPPPEPPRCPPTAPKAYGRLPQPEGPDAQGASPRTHLTREMFEEARPPPPHPPLETTEGHCIPEREEHGREEQRGSQKGCPVGTAGGGSWTTKAHPIPRQPTNTRIDMRRQDTPKARPVVQRAANMEEVEDQGYPSPAPRLVAKRHLLSPQGAHAAIKWQNEMLFDPACAPSKVVWILSRR